MIPDFCIFAHGNHHDQIPHPIRTSSPLVRTRLCTGRYEIQEVPKHPGQQPFCQGSVIVIFLV